MDQYVQTVMRARALWALVVKYVLNVAISSLIFNKSENCQTQKVISFTKGKRKDLLRIRRFQVGILTRSWIVNKLVRSGDLSFSTHRYTQTGLTGTQLG